MLELSPLAKTWIFDIDGTLVKHNGHKNGGDLLLDGVQEFFATVSPDDKIILLTARESEHLENLKIFLQKNNIRYDHLIGDMTFGERILVNDRKPNGLPTAFAINKKRDEALALDYKINEKL